MGNRLPIPLTLLWRPAVLGTMVYVTLFAVVGTFLLATTPLGDYGELLGAPRVAGLTVFQLLTGVHVSIGAVLVVDLRGASQGPPGIRRAHLIGGVLAILLIVGVQVVLLAMRRVAESGG